MHIAVHLLIFSIIFSWSFDDFMNWKFFYFNESRTTISHFLHIFHYKSFHFLQRLSQNRNSHLENLFSYKEFWKFLLRLAALFASLSQSTNQTLHYQNVSCENKGNVPEKFMLAQIYFRYIIFILFKWCRKTIWIILNLFNLESIILFQRRILDNESGSKYKPRILDEILLSSQYMCIYFNICARFYSVIMN